MKINIIEGEFSVCKLDGIESIDLSRQFTFVSVTDEEISLVCRSENVPKTNARDDGWRMLRIEGQLDFSLVGILANISKILAQEKVGIFAISTYNTDYILCKQFDLDRAVASLKSNGYEF